MQRALFVGCRTSTICSTGMTGRPGREGSGQLEPGHEGTPACSRWRAEPGCSACCLGQLRGGWSRGERMSILGYGPAVPRARWALAAGYRSSNRPRTRSAGAWHAPRSAVAGSVGPAGKLLCRCLLTPACRALPAVESSPPPPTTRGRVALRGVQLAHELSQKRHETVPTPLGRAAWPQRPAAPSSRGADVGATCRWL